MMNQADHAYKHWEALHNMGYGLDDIETNGELGAMRYIAEHTPLEVVAFDVGANTGVYAEHLFHAFRQAGKQSVIHCLEPSSDVFPDLERRAASLAGMEAHQIALSDEIKRDTLFKCGRDGTPYSGLSSLYRRSLSHLNILPIGSEVVACTTLDQFCYKRRIEHIHFLKMDVEGHEIYVLFGAQWFLTETPHIDYIQFEFGGCNLDSRTYFKDFWYALSPQYHIYRITPDGLVLILAYEERHEVFLTVNYLAIGKHLPMPRESFIRTVG